MKDLCIPTVGQGHYEGYIPLFLYSISEVYPEATAIVFTGGEPTEALSKSMELLRGRNISIVTDEFSDYKAGARAPAMWRFLLFTTERFEKYFSSFDYFYVTDVDFIFCPETPSLLTQHLTHCKVIDLPYSTYMRPYQPEILAAHLFATREFALHVRDVVDAYDELVKERGVDIFDVVPRHPDERLLYEIVVKSGLSLPPKLDPYSVEREFDLFDPSNCDQELFNSHHGIHLGLGRKRLLVLNRKMWSSLFNRDFYRGYAAWLSKLRQDDIFTELLSLTPDWAAKTVYKMMTVLKVGVDEE